MRPGALWVEMALGIWARDLTRSLVPVRRALPSLRAQAFLPLMPTPSCAAAPVPILQSQQQRLPPRITERVRQGRPLSGAGDQAPPLHRAAQPRLGHSLALSLRRASRWARACGATALSPGPGETRPCARVRGRRGRDGDAQADKQELERKSGKKRSCGGPRVATITIIIVERTQPGLLFFFSPFSKLNVSWSRAEGINLLKNKCRVRRQAVIKVLTDQSASDSEPAIILTESNEHSKPRSAPNMKGDVICWQPASRRGSRGEPEWRARRGGVRGGRRERRERGVSRGGEL